jgi:MFS transporter, NNP family, nitrate/nitrite transporter
MPAFYDTLMHTYGLSSHWAWRDAFFLPFGLITAWAILMIMLCPDTPTGKWADRRKIIEGNLRAEHNAGHLVVHSGLGEATHTSYHPHDQAHVPADVEKGEKGEKGSQPDNTDIAAGEVTEVDAEYTHEIVQNPTPKEILRVIASPQTIFLAAAYFSSFGAELAVNAILGAYYLKVWSSAPFKYILRVVELPTPQPEQCRKLGCHFRNTKLHW